MFAGNVGESQNLDVYLEAAKLLPPELDIQWVIVGDGRDLARFKEAVASADCQDRFVFTGRLPMEAMPSYFAVADAMLVSLQDTAIFRMTVPFKLQSYLAAGRPIVGSIGGEAKRIIDQSKAGFCAEPNDPQALAAEIVKFCTLTKEARYALGSYGAEYYERNFSAERVYSMFESYLSDAR
jgi:glycosyltransferase involved in cell wall biosynthesis